MDAALAALEREQPELRAVVATAGLDDDLACVLAGSEFALGVLQRWPASAIHLVESGRLVDDGAPDAAASWDDATTDTDMAAALRAVRQREMLRIVWRDLTGRASTEQTLAHLSELADAMISAACEFSLDRLRVTRGIELDPPVILAMGKLGGRELNFSSDIDLVFLFEQGGAEAPAHYLRHARRFIALLDERTEEGFVFRVDARLRPFGQSGALVLSIGAFEDYLQTHGREWERYAYVKARAVSGKPDAIARVGEALRSFVYRRYVDYGLFESLREMKRMIEDDVAQREKQGDIKRGDGGIREIEFIVQAMQLIRGGRQRGLQRPALGEALQRLIELGHVSQRTGDDLYGAYYFLRRLENHLQMWCDRQTHRLPDDELERARLAYTMGEEDWPALYAQIELHRERVRDRFHDLLGPVEDEAEDASLASRVWRQRIAEDRLDDALGQLGARDAADARRTIERLWRSPVLGRLDQRGRKRLHRLMPALIEKALATDEGDIVLTRLADIVEGVGRRSAYFSLLNENPQALLRLIDLCGRSEYLARQVADNPLLMDSLIDPAVVQLPTPEQRVAQLGEGLAGIQDDDLEAIIDTLAHFKHSAVFEVAVADIGGHLTIMRVSDHLTAVAEAVVHAIITVAGRALEARHGAPGDCRFGALAYGKLGGLELGYGSDLDLVFAYDCGGEDPATTGDRPIAASVFFARLVQRFAHIAGSPTRFGALYQIDMRLRPSGNSGPLVSSVDAFDRYQSQSAWTWEHQALLRARPVAGDEALCARLAAIRHAHLTAPRDADVLAADIVAMRKRLRAAGPRERPGQFDIKHGEGGLLDTEFLIQYWLLRHAHECPELVEHSDHMRQLDALGSSAVIDEPTRRSVQAAYLDYRTAVHRQALLGEKSAVDEQRFLAPRTFVSALWRETFRSLL